MTLQESNEVWVLSRKLHIDENGNKIDVNLSPFTWPQIGGPWIEISAGKTSIRLDMESIICLALQSSQPLERQFVVMKSILKHNFVPGMWT